MLDCPDTLKFNTFIYNFRLVNVKVTVEQLSIHDKFYVQDDIIKIPLWLAKLHYKENSCTIEEFEQIETTLNMIISNQQLSKNNLIPVEQDFYLMVNDYFNFYMKYKLRYLELDDTISENEKTETEQELITQLKNQKIKFKKIVDMRKKLLLMNCYLGYNRSLIKNMAFEECIIYNNICDTLKNFNDNFSYEL